MNILEHIITMSAADETDRVMVDVTQKEGRITDGAKVSGEDVAAGDDETVANGITIGAERGGKHGTPYGAPPGGCADGEEGYGCWGAVGVQVLYPR